MVRAMNTEKEALQRVQGALYHLRRGLAPFVEARMKAGTGRNGRSMRAAPPAAIRAACSTSTASRRR
jgi:hypothetical protein